MHFQQLDNGLYEGIAEESDLAPKASELEDIFLEFSKNSPDLMRSLATSGFTSLPVAESEKLKEMLNTALAEVVHGNKK